MNKVIRTIISFLFSLMKENTRIDIYHKFETIGDLVFKLNPEITPETKIKDICFPR